MRADKCEALGDTAEEESFEEQKEVEAQVWVWWGSKSTLEGDGCSNDTGEALWEDCVLPGKGASWWAAGALLCGDRLPYGRFPSRAHLGAGVAAAVGVLAPSDSPRLRHWVPGKKERPPRTQPRAQGHQQAPDLLLRLLWEAPGDGDTAELGFNNASCPL